MHGIETIVRLNAEAVDTSECPTLVLWEADSRFRQKDGRFCLETDEESLRELKRFIMMLPERRLLQLMRQILRSSRPRSRRKVGFRWAHTNEWDKVVDFVFHLPCAEQKHVLTWVASRLGQLIEQRSIASARRLEKRHPFFPDRVSRFSPPEFFDE